MKLPKQPTITVKRRTGLLNRAAVDLVTNGKACWAAICRAEDGSYYIDPSLHVPEQTLLVKKVHRSGVQSRVGTGSEIPDGIFELVWDEEEGVIRMVPQ